MSITLIEKLKRLEGADLVGKVLVGMNRGNQVVSEAIARIEALEAENAQLRAANFNTVAFGTPKPERTKN